MLSSDLYPAGGVRSSFCDESCVPFMISRREVAAQCLLMWLGRSVAGLELGVKSFDIDLLKNCRHFSHETRDDSLRLK